MHRLISQRTARTGIALQVWKLCNEFSTAAGECVQCNPNSGDGPKAPNAEPILVCHPGCLGAGNRALYPSVKNLELC